jgi:hypothetical protein
MQKCNKTSGLVKVDEITANIQQQASQNGPRSDYSEKLNAEAVKVINEAFTELQGIFSAWKQSFPDAEILGAGKRQFTKALIDNGITMREQLENGLYYARRSGSPYWPDLEKIVEWCRMPAALDGIPTAIDSYEEFCKKCHALDSAGFSHVIVRLAGVDAGTWEMRNLPRDKSFPLYKRSYDVLIRRVKNGEIVGETVAPGLPEEVGIQCSRKQNKKNMAKLFKDAGL